MDHINDSIFKRMNKDMIKAIIVIVEEFLISAYSQDYLRYDFFYYIGIGIWKIRIAKDVTDKEQICLGAAINPVTNFNYDTRYLISYIFVIKAIHYLL